MQTHVGRASTRQCPLSACRHPEVAAQVELPSEMTPTGDNDRPTPQGKLPRVSEANAKANESLHREHAAVALELFCGSAGLSHACHAVGFRIVPVDWKGNKHASKVPITRLDLSKEADQLHIWHMMATLPVKYLHMGPPCGTYSRAREKRIPKWALARNAPNPQPLRSEKFPEGLPTLRGEAKAKVATANILANFSARVATHCIKHSIGFTVENPARSLLWLMPEMRILLADRAANMVVLTACMWGSRRNKKTGIFTNIPGISDMGIPCDGKPEHLPWGIRYSGGWSFATAEECEYPIEMCMALALRAAKNCSLRTDGDLTVIKARTKPSLETLQARAAVGPSREASGYLKLY